MKWLVFAFRNLFRNARRTVITVTIAATGVASILCSSGFALYTYSTLQEMSARDSGHLLLADPRYFEQDETQPLALGLANYAPIQTALEQDARVQAVLPRIEFSGLISNNDKSVIFTANGVDAREWQVKGVVYKLLQGAPLSTEVDPAQDPEIMLTRDLARTLKAEVGSSLTLLVTASSGSLNALDVQVRGIFSTGVPELDERFMLVPYQTAQEILLSDKVSTLAVYLHDTEQTDALLAEVRATHPQLGVHTWLQEAVFYQKVRALYNRIFGTLGLILIVIVFFAVFNTLSMAVVERTREIGTLAALGTYRAEILRLFMLEALLIGLVGSFFGVLSTFVTAYAVQFSGIQMPAPPGRSEPYPFIIELSLPLSIYTCLAIILICVLAAWLAARRGVNKSIVEALADV